MATVLIVDDDPDVLDALSAVIASAGHVVERAGSGLAALDILDLDRSLELLLTDVIMPGLNGLNLARMARLRRANIRVLYISGFNELEAIRKTRGRVSASCSASRSCRPISSERLQRRSP